MSDASATSGTAPGRWTSGVWATEACTDEVRAFVAGALGVPDGADGVRLEPFHARPWSSVWTATTPDGRRWYVKQNAPPQSHETRVVLRLAALAPDDVVPVAGADAERDLLLTPDLGDTVRARHGDGDADVWCRVVAAGADLQRRVADASATWPLWTLRPEDAAADLAGRLDRLGALPHADPRRLDAERVAALRDLLPRVRGWGEEVAALGLPLTLNHNDLHGANALVDDGTGSSLRFFDFGDCVRTEPLAVLAVPLGVLAEEWGSPHDPRLRRVLDAALEVWSDLATARALRAAAPAAVRLGRLARAESWRRLTTVMTDEERAAVGSAEAESIAQLLGPAPTGARERGRRADG